MVSLLQELPERWNNTKKIAITVKQQVAPLQAAEVANIRKQSATFDVTQHEYRERFRSLAAFFYDCQTPYEVIDKENSVITAMEKEMAAMQASGVNFEVAIPDYKQLKMCRKELAMVKTLWDYATIIRMSIDDWKTTPWREINIEQMDIDCKKFAKDVRSLDKEMRAWDTYAGVENTIKNMMTSLRAVGDLQNPAIRDRHWTQLMQATGVSL